MDLQLFFSPVPAQYIPEDLPHNSFLQSIHVYGERMPDYKSADIALIGLEESRGNPDNAGCSKAANQIRKKLYRLKKGSERLKVVDLGNLRNGVTLEETYRRVQVVCEMMLENNVLPLLFGGSHDLDYGQYMGYESMEKLISVLNIDAVLDMEESMAKVPNARNHIHDILVHEPNYLFNYSVLGYQSYLSDPDAIAILEKLYYDTYRVGHVRQHMEEMEPVVREADMLSFDIGALKGSDAPGTERAQPFGLTGEEACQLSWYAGHSDKLSSAGFYEYNPDFDDARQSTAAILATMIWYFIEGFYQRKDEVSFKSSYYTKFVVAMPTEPENLVFYKSSISGKWWMEVPYPVEANAMQRQCIVPCSYLDYEIANQGELPDRWISIHAKLF